jgi:CBS domain-containing protein
MRLVKDVMTKTVVCADEDATFQKLVRLMHDARVSSIPVVDPVGRVVGIVSEGDLLLKEDLAFQREVHLFEGREFRTERRKAAGLKARDIMTAPAIMAGPDDGLAEAAHTMHSNRVRRLPVVDDDGQLLGIVSRVDLLGAYLREDPDLILEVEEMLSRDFSLGADALHVDAHEGVVYLEGKVEARSAIGEIGRAVRRIDGVVGVDAHVSWDLDDSTVQLGPVPWVGF